MNPDILAILLQILIVLAICAGTLLFVGLICFGIYLVLSLALRRQERARLFLDLLETGMKQGRSPEHTIVSLANAEDRSLGVWFYLLAGYIEQGYRLDQALDKVPCYLPRRIRAIFKISQEVGDLRKVLPVCRKTLQDGFSNALSTQNNLSVVLFSLPLGPVAIVFMFIWVLPKLMEVFKDMVPDQMVPMEYFYMSKILAFVSAGVWLLFYTMMGLQNAGPRFAAWLEGAFWTIAHRLELLLPWRYKRLQRDFSSLLGLLLDAGLPEPRAIQVAAEGTGNWFFQQRALAAVEEMRQGAKFTQAVRLLDTHGEFKWRLENAAAGSAGFAGALDGWQESLDSKAFAQQQVVSQIVTTSLVILNGLMVGLAAVGMFMVFQRILSGI